MNEQISALMDDEIAAEDAAHLITAIESGQHAAEVWSRYHLIGDMMRGSMVMDADFKQRVMQKIEQEVTILSPAAMGSARGEQNDANRSRKISAVWSIAASVAAVAVVGGLVFQQPKQDERVFSSADVAQNIPSEYLTAHQASAPSGGVYYFQSANYPER